MPFWSKETRPPTPPLFDANNSVDKNFDILRDSIVPKSRLEINGPKNGDASLSFSYNQRFRVTDTGIKTTKDVLGIVLRENNNLLIWNKRCAKDSAEYMESTNPIDWVSYYEEFLLARRDVEKIGDKFEEARKKLNKLGRESLHGLARSRYPGIPSAFGVDMLRGEVEGEIIMETSQREATKKQIYKQGDLRNLAIIENINSEFGIKRYIDELANFYTGLKTGQGR
jgi:hypothetical protein